MKNQNNVSTNNEIPIMAVLMAVSGIFLFSMKAILVKLAYQYPTDASTTLMLRMVFSLPFFVVIGFFQNRRRTEKSTITSTDWLMVLLLGFSGYYLASLLDFKGLEYISTSLERLIIFSSPTMVVLLNKFISKKPISLNQWIAIAITYIGLVITFGDKLSGTELNSGVWIGSMFVFGSAFSYSIYLVWSQNLIKKLGSIMQTSYTMTVASVIVIVHYSVVHGIGDVGAIPIEVVLICIVMAVFCTVLPSYIFTEALNRIDASKVSIIGSIGPVFTIVFSYFILNETISLNEILGGIVIVLGVVWISIQKK